MDLRARSSQQLPIESNRRNFAATMGHLGRPPLPSSRPPTGVKLTPLEKSPSITRLPGSEDAASPLSRSPSGHLNTLRSIRRSTPSPVRSSWPFGSDVSKLLGPDAWTRMAELAAPASGWGRSAEPEANSRCASPDVRVRRIRRPADFGATIGTCNKNRGRSCSAATGNATSNANIDKVPAADAGAASPASTESALQAQRRPERCNSLPPTGTNKADGDAAAAAKARAVATLQRLFFEEMAKGDTDASGAAARALKRLSEAPQTKEQNSPSDEKAAAESAPRAAISLSPPPEVELPAERPDTPVEEPTAEDRSAAEVQNSHLSQQVAALAARPAVPRRPELSCGRRRPRPASRVAVRN
mmetsp:Transcript_112551/g.199508  ORF Transcript_112551/g.199508 Transcript_112551/m.199508 type:complete len:358 (-) Transcript_112551:282-1355(-)